MTERDANQLIRDLVHGGPWQPDPNHPPIEDCPDQECLDCGARACPLGEPLHFHHDGCPADCGV